MAVSYPVHRQVCGWQAQLVPRCPEPRLRRNLVCEIAVVGAGYTGLAAARTWAQARPDDRVAVLDAGIVGEGGPGRGSGFLLGNAIGEYANARAVGNATPRSELLGKTFDWLRALIDEHGIRCELDAGGVYLAAATERGRKALQRHRDLLEAAGLSFEEFDRLALARRLGTRYYGYALRAPDCALVQPAALIRGLADSLPGNVTLYEESPAVELRAEGGGWRVECPDGSLLARRVVLANNAFVRGLGVGGDRLAAAFVYAGLTAPLAQRLLAGLGSESRWGVLPAHRLGAALRRTGDGRMLVSAFGGREREESGARVQRRLGLVLARRFPHLGVDEAADPFQYVWGAATAVTRNGAPFWGEVRPRLFVSAGCSGGDMVKCTLLGRLIADLALGRPGPDVASLFGSASRMLPVPLRRLGAALRSPWERRAAGGES